jgi:hypothetical protein
MSPSEMHAFEKAMMSDPFLADALEGFQTSDATLADKHLSEINHKVSSKKDEAKVVGMSSSAKWIRVAAMFIVLVGAGLITYYILNKPQENTTIAAIESQPSLPVDSISATDQSTSLQAAPLNATNDHPTTSSPVLKNDIPMADGAVAAAPLASKRSAAETEESALSDTSVQIQALDARKMATTASAPKISDETSANQNSTAQPKDGWVKFQAYVDKEVDQAKEKNSALTAMKVELEFSVDKEGNVADIKILSASNTEVAKVAADILRKSPRWTPLANNARARIVINF